MLRRFECRFHTSAPVVFVTGFMDSPEELGPIGGLPPRSSRASQSRRSAGSVPTSTTPSMRSALAGLMPPPTPTCSATPPTLAGQVILDTAIDQVLLSPGVDRLVIVGVS
jgi:hypothetical protein